MSKETLDTVRDLIEVEGLSQRTVAREAGISGTTLNQLLQGKYGADDTLVTEKLANWLSSRELARKLGKKTDGLFKFVETPTAKKIRAVFEFVATLHDISVIYGGAGIGKTTALKKYAEKQPNCWVVTATPATASVAAILEEIALALGLRDFPGRASRVQREIIRRLRDTKGVLIIDEAQHLSINSLEAIRCIHDATEIGLILCGNESVYSRLTAGGSRTAAFAQLFSRVGKRLRLTKNLPGDGIALAKSFGVIGDKELDLIDEISKNPGGLRMVAKTLQLSAIYAKEDGGHVTLENITEAWQELSGRD